ncbi:ripped pocket [Haematobia irritans]|uniref:ripped pocket n=1 Tax=Haematobia irritans TaxID=7368 RepID=UPI003F4FAEA1
MMSHKSDKNKNNLDEIQSLPIIEKPSVYSDGISSKQNRSLSVGIKQVYLEYCANTSIHGVQYLGDSRPWKEKFFWICVFIVSICCCSKLIGRVYSKWTETPVIVSFAEKSTPVWNIPFPAITICSETKRPKKMQGPSYAELLKEWKSSVAEGKHFHPNINSTEFLEFLTLLHICNTQIIDSMPRISHQPIDYFEILNRMLPDFDNHYLYCKWFGNFSHCDKLFSKTYTEEGICFTFNGLNPTDLYRNNTIQYQRALETTTAFKYSKDVNRSLSWSLENGYDHNSGLETYPVRVLSAGSRAGLSIAFLNLKHEVDFGCRGPVQGFKVLLHSPDDVPLVSKQFVRIPMGREVLIAVKPNMITTSSGIAEYPPHRRQCYLNSERSLRFFKVYTQNNCELECLTNYTLKTCGCVKFSMPHTPDMPVCTEDKIQCYDRAEDGLLFKEFSEGMKGTNFNSRGETECNCMPACTSLAYHTEISQGSFDTENMLHAFGEKKFLEDNPDIEMSRLSIYFKENQFITSKRSELYGVTDFLANCGGIFGLFMGFSILSMVEVIYHFSLRLWSNMRKQK